MTFEEIYEQIKDIQGWMGREDCHALYEYTKDMKEAMIVEIGSFTGVSTKTMALSSPTSHITAIDCYIPWETYLSPSVVKINKDRFFSIEDVKETFLKNIKGLNIKLIVDKSQNVEWTVPTDFLHIDGDHHYDAVKKDIENFVPYVKKGHYVFFHDFTAIGDPGEYGIREAISLYTDKYFSEVKLVSGFACCKKK